LGASASARHNAHAVGITGWPSACFGSDAALADSSHSVVSYDWKLDIIRRRSFYDSFFEAIFHVQNTIEDALSRMSDGSAHADYAAFGLLCGAILIGCLTAWWRR
jgi:hypothetical protein